MDLEVRGRPSTLRRFSLSLLLEVQADDVRDMELVETFPLD
jgi:hypothetical protein